MILGPFWCQELNAWIRFEYIDGPIVVQLAKRNEENPRVTQDWQQADFSEGGTWVVYDGNTPTIYSLQKEASTGLVLYRTEGNINQITKDVQVDRCIVSEAGFEWKPARKSQGLDFDRDKMSKVGPSTFPLTPEQIEQQRKAVAAIINEAREAARIRVKSPYFSEDQLAYLCAELNRVLIGFAPEQYIDGKLYLKELQQVIQDPKNELHQKIINETAKTAFDHDTFPLRFQNLQSTEISGVLSEIRLHKKAYYFDLLKEEGQYLAGKLGLDINFKALSVLPQTTSNGMSSSAPHQQVAISHSAFEAAISLNDILQKTNKEIQLAVEKAQENYSKWYAKKPCDNSRGPNGFFTWLRHGATGQRFAERFRKEINGMSSDVESICSINEFLRAPKTAYHRHSFASFLLDELKGIKNSPWALMQHDNHKLYHKKNIIEQLDRFNFDAQAFAI